jgi:hypothetical protein
MSSFLFTHEVPQHVRPSPHAGVHVAPPLLELDELDELEGMQHARHVAG